MTEKDIEYMYKETKQKVASECEKNYRRPKMPHLREVSIHRETLCSLLDTDDKEVINAVIDGIANGKFADTKYERSIEGFVLKDVIRDNIHDKEIVKKSFEAMEKMLNSTREFLKGDDKERAVAGINSMQNMLYAIADLREDYPTSLGKQTDHIYDVYKQMMKEYSLSGLYHDGVHRSFEEVENYFQGRDAYKDAVEIETIRKQENSAWETKEQLDAAKQRIYNKFTKKEIAEYEQSHAEQVKREDAKYVSELGEFLGEHENRNLSKEHQKQITEIRLKHSDKELAAAYENYKDVARKPKEGEKAEERPASHKVPKRAVFLARAESKRQA